MTRTGYGGRGQPSWQPLDAALNMPPERYSHPVRQRVAQAAAVTSFDEVVTQMRQHTGTAVPKRQAEALTQRAAQDLAAFDAQPDRVVAVPGSACEPSEENLWNRLRLFANVNSQCVDECVDATDKGGWSFP